MNNYQDRGNRGGGFRGGNGGGGAPYQKKTWGADRGGERDKPMFKATCAECGKACEVPFRPTGDKPVYCRDCFNSKREPSDSRGGSRPDFSNRAPRRDFGDKASFRPDTRPDPRLSLANDELKKQLSEISSKLDRLLSVMEKGSVAKKETSESVKSSEETPKPKISKTRTGKAKK
ncbi:MAG: CxxC-x17-CxxC domain-containing protein [Patescibacteria group bacterium]